QARLTGLEKISIAKVPTANTEAYELYLKGRFFWNKRTGADLKRAIDYFNQAIAKDPNYALAYAGLADSYTLLSVFSAASPQDSIPQARVAAKKALELDNTLAEAIAEYQKAVELDDDPQALAFLGQAQARIGQHDKAQKILSRMTEEAKSRYVSAYSFALMFIALGDKERAIDALERAYREGAAN